MTATTTPLPAGTDIAETIGGKAHSRAILFDVAGADAMGAVGASPAANTMLGRLKAIADAIATVVGHVDGIEGLLTALNGYVDGLEAALAAQATAAKQDEAKAAIQALAPSAAPFAITPHATNALERQIRAISVVTGGDITFRYPGEGADRTITVPAGFYPLSATHIRATTTASGLTGW